LHHVLRCTQRADAAFASGESGAPGLSGVSVNPAAGDPSRSSTRSSIDTASHDARRRRSPRPRGDRARGGAVSLDPRQIASTPFRNVTALLDLQGYLEGYRRALSARVFTLTGKHYRDANPGGGPGLFARGYSPTKKWSEAVPTGDYLQSL